MSINVRVWVLGLSVLGQDARGNLVDLADKLEHGVLRQLAESKLSLRNVTRIGLAKDGMAVPGNDTARVQSVPQVLGNVGVAKVGSHGLLHLGEPVEHFLIGAVPLSAYSFNFRADNLQSVERSGETVKASRKGQHRGAQSAADQVGCVGADVATLMISVDS